MNLGRLVKNNEQNLINQLEQENRRNSITAVATDKSKWNQLENRRAKKRLGELEEKMSTQEESSVNLSQFIQIVKQVTSGQELTPFILNQLISKIYVGQARKDLETGKRINEVEIQYKVSIVNELINEACKFAC